LQFDEKVRTEKRIFFLNLISMTRRVTLGCMTSCKFDSKSIDDTAA